MATFILTTALNGLKSGLQKYNPITYLKSNLGPLSSLVFRDQDKHKFKDNLTSRLGDLKVQTCQYGEAIPLVYGTCQLSGNLLWCSNIREVINDTTTSQKIGGKGGQTVSSTVRNYYYYANFAIAICEGMIDKLNQVWADTELLNLQNYSHTIYYGTEEQLPDPTMESYLGHGNVPGHRGLAYIVFRDFPLTNFGNRIPNFSFEVSRNPYRQQENDRVEKMISSVIMIPGSGEFVYDTTVQYQLKGASVNGTWYVNGSKTRINENNNSNMADAVLATDQLQQTLTNLQWVAPVVAWYADGINIKDCTITPRVEYNFDDQRLLIDTKPDVWKVGDKYRYQARLISKDDQGRPRYGGTISDSSIINYLQLLRKRGLKIMFYPLIMVDDEQKSWRGRISGVATDLEHFFTGPDGYDHFILHYANLVKGRVDAFVMGSEMIGLTSITDVDHHFPAVEHFVQLASRVKQILGPQVIVTYAGDWSEYHHTDGGWYNMDPLWASPDIDVIGIDAYFPLTDILDTDDISKEDIINGWHSGEGYDWYYLDSVNRQHKQYFKDEDPQNPGKFAWKNIAYWWENSHYNPDGSQTAWQPQSKPIWFTEYGFPSVDGASNQPNVFYDPNSVEGGFPRYSKGQIDFHTQRICLQATEEYWRNSKMVTNKFVWTWDARPYPFFPNLLDVWADGNTWAYGHWLNGKLGNTLLADVVEDLGHKVGLTHSQLDTGELYDHLDGMVINSPNSYKTLLAILQKAYFFQVQESVQQLHFYRTDHRSDAVLVLDISQLILDDKHNIMTVILDDEGNSYDFLNISYLSREDNYNLCNRTIRRYNLLENNNTDVLYDNKSNITLPIIFSAENINYIGENLLKLQQAQQLQLEFSLTLEIKLELGDKFCLSDVHNLLPPECRDILLNDNFQVTAVDWQDNRPIHIQAERVAVYNKLATHNVMNTIQVTELITPNSQAILEVMELPQLQGKIHNTPLLYFIAKAEEPHWQGGKLFSSYNGVDYQAEADILSSSIVGSLYSLLRPALPYTLDYANKITIKLLDSIEASLESIDINTLLNGKNLALLGNELLQFQRADFNADGTYTLSVLLRGLYGTEESMASHQIGESFVLLDQHVLNQTVDDGTLGMNRFYKLVSFGQTVEQCETVVNHVVQGTNLLCLAPVNLQQYPLADGTIRLSWQRRSRGSYNWNDAIDLPLPEKREIYQITIYDHNTDIVLLETKVYDVSYYIYTPAIVSQQIYFSVGQIDDYQRLGKIATSV